MIRALSFVLVVLGAAASACSRSASEAPAGAASGPLASASPSAAPGSSGSAPAAAASVQVAQAASGNDISIQQLADGRVTLKTTTLWGAPVDTTYENCTFYRSALPVLKRQLSEDRGRVLDGICVEPPKGAR